MKSASTAWIIVLVMASAQAVAGPEGKPAGEFARKATWKTPTMEETRGRALQWLADRNLEEKTRADVEMLWSGADREGVDGAASLELVASTLAAGDPRAGRLLATCALAHRPLMLEPTDWLAADDVGPFGRNHLRLLYGRWLVQQSLIDEATEQLAELKVEDVADPATLLFYQAVVYHHTLARDAGLAAINRLLENEAVVPRRFSTVARLMQADLEGLKDESLDHIARRMEDIRRRLDLGRAGPKVRGVEDGVIASLDKMIDKLEQQQQAAAAAAAAAAKKGGRGAMQPGAPMPDSRPAEMKGPGEASKKPIGDSSGWGNLPPRERQEALQQIGKDFPAHYRDVIEQYFRKLATDSNDKGDQ
jgi:hypothetical protein